ncbi:calcitonin receptor-like [Anthonomus grandis grandis]|uniref:calcitonin receptor-like n=1 Tax=Anthonomus grandis grandis TaxID=2921223 RepID=UPI002165977A|nr:calcitonin receptor-like [Anthonomus grandis grandis]XP_050309565.1 calcitonin receptor-like [Anthonomus grandis grandis]XP_050309566.1 calcitonin receptor-like [Anthonomus grandis grandis]XP_050309567.1 calcitonin receptor-like [Anthonomus grandis grandis]
MINVTQLDRNDLDISNTTTTCGKRNNTIEGWCPEVFDDALCWPPAPPGTISNQSCPRIDGFNSNKLAYKQCWENGSWFVNHENVTWSDYRDCIDYESLEFYNFVNFLYVIGYGISLVALLVSLWIFLSFRTLRCIRIRIHVQLFVSFILNNIMWIVWYRKVIPQVAVPLENPAWCQFLHIAKEYYMVANYMWMFCEALHLHLALVVVFVREERTMKWFYFVGWGIPFIIVLVHSLIRIFYNQDTDFCWLHEKTFGSWFISVPIVFTLTLSMIFLINILRVILTIMHPNSPNPAPIGIRRAVRAALILTPLFGLQFILIPVRPDTEHPMYHAYVYTSVIIIPYQGFCCAVLFCFANHDVHQAIKRSFQRNLTRQNTRWSNYQTGESGAAVFMVNANGQNGNTVPLLSLHRKSTQGSVKL